MKPGSASVGIGNLANGVAELARSHVEARQALRLTRRAGSRAHVASYRSLGAFRLLLEVQSPDALRRFVNELLGPLLEYAQNRDTPLLETLEALSAARWIRRAAARKLGIHINSMTYRVERIQTLTGLKRLTITAPPDSAFNWDEALACVAGMPELEELILAENRSLSDSALVHLDNAPLTS